MQPLYLLLVSNSLQQQQAVSIHKASNATGILQAKTAAGLLSEDAAATHNPNGCQATVSTHLLLFLMHQLFALSCSCVRRLLRCCQLALQLRHARLKH